MIGISNAVQSGVNVQLRESLSNPILAALISFGIGTLVLAVAFACFNKNPVPNISDFRQIPYSRFLGGLLGAFYVLTVVFIVRDIGPANMICLVVAGQMAAPQQQNIGGGRGAVGERGGLVFSGGAGRKAYGYAQ